MALIKCKECGEEISKKAEQCPKCGAPKKKRIGFFKWLLIIFVGLVVIGTILPEPETTKTATSPKTSSKTTVTDTDNDSPSSTPVKDEESIVKVEDTFSTRKFEIKLNKVYTNNFVGSQYFNSQPPEGAVFVVVRWQFKNISGKPLSGFSIPSLFLIDANNSKYKLDAEATIAIKTALNMDNFVLSNVNPDILVKDATVFEVSKSLYDPKTWHILVDADSNQDVVLK